MKAYAQNLINTNYMLSTLAHKHGPVEVGGVRICLYKINSKLPQLFSYTQNTTVKKISNSGLVHIDIYSWRSKLKWPYQVNLRQGIVLVKGRKYLHWNFCVVAWEEV